MAVGANTYAAKEDIERLIGDIVESRTFGAATVPTEAQVEEELDNAAAELNVALDNAGYTVPVSEADFPIAYAFLKASNASCAAAVLLATIPGDTYNPDEEVEQPATTRSDMYSIKCKAAIKRITDQKLRAGRRVGRLEYFYSGSQQTDGGKEKLPIFTRGEDDYPGRRSLTGESVTE